MSSLYSCLHMTILADHHYVSDVSHWGFRSILQRIVLIFRFALPICQTFKNRQKWDCILCSKSDVGDNEVAVHGFKPSQHWLPARSPQGRSDSNLVIVGFHGEGSSTPSCTWIHIFIFSLAFNGLDYINYKREQAPLSWVHETQLLGVARCRW